MSRTDIEPHANLGDKDLISFFQRWRWLQTPTGPTTLDFRRVNFLAPWAVCLFSSYALWLRTVKKKRAKVLVDPHTVAGNYIVQSGMLELLEQDIVPPDTDANDRIAKINQIERSDQIPGFVSEVMSLLMIDDEEMEGAVKYSLVELLRNVVQHSDSPYGGLAMAHYYPTTGLVEIVVADSGVGIRETLSRKYPEIDNDLKAVKFATQPHVSGTFKAGAYNEMKENAGLGLFFIKQIASLSGGGFFLGSGNVLSDIWGDSEGNQKKLYKSSKKGGWKGTFALLQLRKNTIGDFDAVLQTCRKLAEEARKDPAVLNLDFIEDIPDMEELKIVRILDFEENVEEASRIRDEVIEKSLSEGKLVVLDFSGIRFATQSFIHALIYKLLRDSENIRSGLSIANCTDSTREAILAVAGYAKASRDGHPEIL